MPKTEPTLRLLPLGGLGEIGKNMMVLESGDDIVVIDAGVLFPEVTMPGVDVVIPDMDYLEDNADRVRGLLITHGHEDHIGAVPYFLKRVNAPVYAPAMAAELIRHKLREARLLDTAELHTVKAGDRIKAGGLEAEWFHVCHSIPDATGIAIDTPVGRVIHTGDFKVDHDPVVGHPTDFLRLAELCQGGIFLLMSDSTYAEDEGYSGSDRVVADGLFELIGRASGRIIVSSFASQIARLQIVADAAFAHGRKMAVVGRSMQNNTRLARELGHLDIPGDTLVSLAEADSMPDEQVIIMTTGSQGEPTSGLVRMSRNDHREVKIRGGDTVIISASPIPGNEVAIYDMIDGLVRLGARVVTNRHANTHVSGHGRREELRMMLNLANPRYFVPVHGEYRMLRSHADLAVDQGIDVENVFLLTDGDVLEVTEDGGRIVERVPAGHVFVHGLGIWDESGNVIVERRSLARDGFVAVAVARDRRTREVRGTAKIISAGFVHAQDEAVLLTDAESELQSVLDRTSTEKLEWPQVEDLVRRTLEKFFSRRTRRRPLIATVAVDL